MRQKKCHTTLLPDNRTVSVTLTRSNLIRLVIEERYGKVIESAFNLVNYQRRVEKFDRSHKVGVSSNYTVVKYNDV